MAVTIHIKVVRWEIANKTLTVHIHLHMNIYRSYTLMCDFSNILFHHVIFRFLRWVTLFWYPWVSYGHSRLPTCYMLWLRVAQHSPEQISICHCLNDILYIILYISVDYAHLSCICRSDIMFYIFEKTKPSEKQWRFDHRIIIWIIVIVFWKSCSRVNNW